VYQIDNGLFENNASIQITQHPKTPENTKRAAKKSDLSESLAALLANLSSPQGEF
jgi:hypothetical protein